MVAGGQFAEVLVDLGVLVGQPLPQLDGPPERRLGLRRPAGLAIKYAELVVAHGQFAGDLRDLGVLVGEPLLQLDGPLVRRLGLRCPAGLEVEDAQLEVASSQTASIPGDLGVIAGQLGEQGPGLLELRDRAWLRAQRRVDKGQARESLAQVGPPRRVVVVLLQESLIVGHRVSSSSLRNGSMPGSLSSRLSLTLVR